MSDTDNVDMVMQLLHDCIGNTAVAVYGSPTARTSITQHCHQPWFDTECRNKHKEVSSYAKLHPYNHLAREWKKQLKQLLRHKKRTYKKLQGQQLCALAKTDLTSFWKKYSKNKERSIVISKADLVAGFPEAAKRTMPQ
jgi:arsenate reductase-like glutaredoxin family protein